MVTKGPKITKNRCFWPFQLNSSSFILITSLISACLIITDLIFAHFALFLPTEKNAWQMDQQTEYYSVWLCLTFCKIKQLGFIFNEKKMKIILLRELLTRGASVKKIGFFFCWVYGHQQKEGRREDTNSYGMVWTLLSLKVHKKIQNGCLGRLTM